MLNVVENRKKATGTCGDWVWAPWEQAAKCVCVLKGWWNTQGTSSTSWPSFHTAPEHRGSCMYLCLNQLFNLYQIWQSYLTLTFPTVSVCIVDKSLHCQSEDTHLSAPEVKSSNGLVILAPSSSCDSSATWLAVSGYDFHLKGHPGLWPTPLNCFVKQTLISLGSAWQLQNVQPVNIYPIVTKTHNSVCLTSESSIYVSSNCWLFPGAELKAAVAWSKWLMDIFPKAANHLKMQLNSAHITYLFGWQFWS